jgi:hypothetical protein
VRDLSALRDSGDPFHNEALLLLRATSIQESIRQWLRLQSAFEWQLQQTATLFESDRRKALAGLQARLRLLVD